SASKDPRRPRACGPTAPPTWPRPRSHPSACRRRVLRARPLYRCREPAGRRRRPRPTSPFPAHGAPPLPQGPRRWGLLRSSARPPRTESPAARGSRAAAATGTRAGAAARERRSRALACAPDLLARPLLRPVGRHVRVVLVIGGVVGRIELAKVEKLEAVRVQDAKQLAGRRVDLDALVVAFGPVDPVDVALGTDELLRGRAFFRAAEDEQHRAA